MSRRSNSNLDATKCLEIQPRFSLEYRSKKGGSFDQFDFTFSTQKSCCALAQRQGRTPKGPRIFMLAGNVPLVGFLLLHHRGGGTAGPLWPPNRNLVPGCNLGNAGGAGARGYCMSGGAASNQRWRLCIGDPRSGLVRRRRFGPRFAGLAPSAAAELGGVRAVAAPTRGVQGRCGEQVQGTNHREHCAGWRPRRRRFWNAALRGVLILREPSQDHSVLARFLPGTLDVFQ